MVNIVESEQIAFCSCVINTRIIAITNKRAGNNMHYLKNNTQLSCSQIFKLNISFPFLSLAPAFKSKQNPTPEKQQKLRKKQISPKAEEQAAVFFNCWDK